MSWLFEHLLTLIIFVPTAGAFVLLFLREDQRDQIRWIALLTSLLTFLLSYLAYKKFLPNADFQLTEVASWITNYGIDYRVGIDGISLFLVLLTTFLTPVTILSTFDSVRHRVKGFMISMLILETGMLGVFMATDLFLFYVFWETMLIPMYFIIGVWGGEQRIYAAVKFVLYTMVGSLLMLVAVLYIYVQAFRQLGHYTANYSELMLLNLSSVEQTWLFLAFAISFAIKVPLFPFHTWLPDAHVEAPTAGSVILAGVLLKMGGFGFLRYCLPLFPGATVQFTPLIVVLAVIGIIYGALVAMVQPDMKKLVAYSSVSHLGFVVLGIFALTSQSVTGGIIQMVNHGLSTGALFLLVGMLYDQTHTRLIADYGGMARVLPHFGTVFLIVVLSSIGLPGLNGFVGEFLILIGSYGTQPVATVFAATGVILAAVYLLWLVQRVFFGRVKIPQSADAETPAAPLTDMTRRQWAVMLPILALIVILGVYPKPILQRMEPAVNKVIAAFQVSLEPSPGESVAFNRNSER